RGLRTAGACVAVRVAGWRLVSAGPGKGSDYRAPLRAGAPRRDPLLDGLVTQTLADGMPAIARLDSFSIHVPSVDWSTWLQVPIVGAGVGGACAGVWLAVRPSRKSTPRSRGYASAFPMALAPRKSSMSCFASTHLRAWSRPRSASG